MSGNAAETEEEKRRAQAAAVGVPPSAEKEKENEKDKPAPPLGLNSVTYGRPFMRFKGPGNASDCIVKDANGVASIDFEKLGKKRSFLHRVFGVSMTVKFEGERGDGVRYCDVFEIGKGGKIKGVQFDLNSPYVGKAEIKAEVNKNTSPLKKLFKGKPFSSAEIIQDIVHDEGQREGRGIKSPYIKENKSEFVDKLKEFQKNNKVKLNYTIGQQAPVFAPVSNVSYIHTNTQTPPNLGQFSPLHNIFLAQRNLRDKVNAGQATPQDHTALNTTNMQITDIMKNGYNLQKNGQNVRVSAQQAKAEHESDKQKFKQFMQSTQVSQGNNVAPSQTRRGSVDVHQNQR